MYTCQSEKLRPVTARHYAEGGDDGGVGGKRGGRGGESISDNVIRGSSIKEKENG